MKTMKLVSLFLFAVLCCKSYAHETVRVIANQNCLVENHVQISDPKQAKLEKKYIEPSNVRFEQKKMYVQLDQNWIVTNAVYTDANGFYILEPKGGWTCGYCHYYNEENIWTCDNCGRRRD